MIPIKIEKQEFEKIKREYLKRIKELFLDKRCTTKEKKHKSEQKRDMLFEKINRELKRLGINKSIDEIFIADFKVLQEIKIKYDENNEIYDSYNNKNEEGKYVINSVYKELYNAYDKINSNEKSWLIRRLGVTVCPYCNRDYINNRENTTSAQLDHFYPRSKYPVFSLSICNLIPSCYACNHIKSNKEISCSPYDESIDFDEQIKFSYLPLNAQFLDDPENIEIIIKSEGDSINNINNMKIKSAYSLNNDYAIEIIKKSIMYNKAFKEELLQTYNDLISSEQELNRLIYGNYIDPIDEGKRPLAKLTHDLLKELKVI